MPLVFEQPNLDVPEETHLYFDPGDGRLITFFVRPTRVDDPTPNPEGIGNLHHIAFTVSRAVYTQVAQRLNERGIWNTGPIDRGFMDSIYFRDPTANCWSSPATSSCRPRAARGRCPRHRPPPARGRRRYNIDRLPRGRRHRRTDPPQGSIPDRATITGAMTAASESERNLSALCGCSTLRTAHRAPLHRASRLSFSRRARKAAAPLAEAMGFDDLPWFWKVRRGAALLRRARRSGIAAYGWVSLKEEWISEPALHIRLSPWAMPTFGIAPPCPPTGGRAFTPRCWRISWASCGPRACAACGSALTSAA